MRTRWLFASVPGRDNNTEVMGREDGPGKASGDEDDVFVSSAWRTVALPSWQGHGGQALVGGGRDEKRGKGREGFIRRDIRGEEKGRVIFSFMYLDVSVPDHEHGGEPSVATSSG